MDWNARLRAALGKGQGVRFGEAAVVSRRVHTLDPGNPGVVSILIHADAGQTFYGRSARDAVLHVDLFHAVGEVDHRRVAAAVRQVCSARQQPELADRCDIQTGTGGGRVTGALTYGRRPSLLASHRNHIHLAALCGDGELELLPALISALEEEVLAGGQELRQVERLCHPPAGGGAPLDLSHYQDQTDSYLRGSGTSPGPGGRGASGAAQGLNPPGRGSATRAPAMAAPGPGAPGAGAGASGAGEPGPWLADEAHLQTAIRLARRLGSPEELKRILDAIRTGQATGGSLFGTGTQGPYLLRELEEEGLIRRDGRGIRITDVGQRLVWTFDRHLTEIKLRFRKLIRRVPRPVLSERPHTADRPSPGVRTGPVRGVAPLVPGSRAGDLAVPQTVLAGLKRTYQARAAAPGAFPCARPPLQLQRQDLHVYVRSGQQPLYICLLIDASASMAGRRIQAAKHLARHLLASTRDRIAVVGFQERDVRVHVPFTRDGSMVEAGLSQVQPAGLTPLAHGLIAGMELIQQSGVRRPLLLLITDGIPTVPKWTIDPLADALAAARRFQGSRIPFGCIGLMPSRRYLEELSAAAGGTLHIVEELHEDALVTIAHRERGRLHGRRR